MLIAIMCDATTVMADKAASAAALAESSHSSDPTALAVAFAVFAAVAIRFVLPEREKPTSALAAEQPEIA